MLLFASTSAVTSQATPAGWTVLGTQSSDTLQTTVWQRTATDTDAGSTVSVPFGTASKSDLHVLVYSGASAASTCQVADGTTTRLRTRGPVPPAAAGWSATGRTSRPRPRPGPLRAVSSPGTRSSGPAPAGSARSSPTPAARSPTGHRHGHRDHRRHERPRRLGHHRPRDQLRPERRRARSHPGGHVPFGVDVGPGGSRDRRRAAAGPRGSATRRRCSCGRRCWTP